MSKIFLAVVDRIRSEFEPLTIHRLQIDPRIMLSTAALLVLPLVGSPFAIDLACQVFIACIGALALMLLTGFAGQVSLGHAGLMAAGAFAVGILHKEMSAPFWVGLPAAAAAGAGLGLIFGLPSLRLRGLYLAVSTLALHFVVVYLGGEYETLRGHSTGIIIDPPQLFGYRVYDGASWYFVLSAAAAITLLLCRNLLKSRTGRAWGAIHAKETVAAALGINVAYYKLLAFVITSSITAASGALFAYYRNFASVEAFSLYLSIQYVAMIIIGGMGTILGAILGAAFVTIMPYAIEFIASYTAGQGQFSRSTFALIYASFGLVMIGFLVLEPRGLIGVARRVQPRWDQLCERGQQKIADLLKGERPR